MKTPLHVPVTLTVITVLTAGLFVVLYHIYGNDALSLVFAAGFSLIATIRQWYNWLYSRKIEREYKTRVAPTHIRRVPEEHFAKWRDAQFGPRTQLTVSDEELASRVRAGRLAQEELDRRNIWDHKTQAALLAWSVSHRDIVP